MRWADLGDEAKAILEWHIDVYSERLNEIAVTVGERPLVNGRTHSSLRGCVSRECFEEMCVFQRDDDREHTFDVLEIFDDSFRSRLNEKALARFHGAATPGIG